ncbi:MAG: pyridoxamine 5'-phosphate oxidase [Sporichthyaceae bacterium]
MSLTMSATERQNFLAQPHVGVVAVDRPGRAPLAVPVWFGYQPGGEVLLWSYAGLKEQLIRAAGRFTLTVQSDAWPNRYVSVEGPVVACQTPAPLEVAVDICVRYLGETDGPEFAKACWAPEGVLFRMRPEHWLSVDYSPVAETLLGAAAALSTHPSA